MTETPANDTETGGNQGRFYKLVGGLVVGLVVAVALLPLLFGGGGSEEPRVVEVEPPLEEPSPESPSPSGEAGSEAESSPQKAGGEKWWRSDSEGAGSGESGSSAAKAPEEASSPSEPEARQARARQPEAAPEEPAPETQPAPREPNPEGQTPPPSPEAEARSGSAASPSAPAGGSQQEAPSAPEQLEQDQDGGEAEPEPSGPKWVVMAGSFRDASNARSLSRRLEEQGFPAEVRTARVNGKTWNRVLVSGGDSRQGARKLVPRLKEAGYNDLLVMEVQ